MNTSAQGRNMTAVEDYLKTLFNLSEWDEQLTNGAVATRLGVSTAAASEMIRKLAERGLVRHERYRGVELTDSGRATAIEMVRRHRLIETYLVERLGYTWDEVHDEAEVLEHAVSPVLVERMADALGHPWRDPHGDPIPTVDGVLHQPPSRPLLTLEVGEGGYVSRLADDDPVLLRWFVDQGIALDTPLRLLEQKPFGGPLSVAVGDGAIPVDLGLQAQSALWVSERLPLPDAGDGCPFPDCRHES